MNLSNYIALCDAITLLMKPLVEIVIHDLVSGKICYISGALSKRKVGDESLLSSTVLEEELDKIIYSKINFDGRLVKSVSVPIEGKWLICINSDLSVFSEMKNLSEIFLNSTNSKKQPDSLFKNDWQEKVHIAIHSFIEEQRWNFNALNTHQKKSLTKHLFDLKAFSEKNAADYIANILSLGRATIFKYLKEWKTT